jgi:DNA-binding NarL/FixJ family response regulator
MSGFEVLPLLHRLQPALRIIVVSIYPAEVFAAKAIAAGACAYLTKEKAPEELISRIRCVMASETREAKIPESGEPKR